MISAHPTNDPTNPLHRLADDASRMSGGAYPKKLSDLSGIAEDINHTLSVAYGLVDALTLALPYVEMAADDPAYKNGVVAKVTVAMREAIAQAVGR